MYIGEPGGSIKAGSLIGLQAGPLILAWSGGRRSWWNEGRCRSSCV